MPSALSHKFLRYCQRTAKTQHNSIKAGGCYCLASPESAVYAPDAPSREQPAAGEHRQRGKIHPRRDQEALPRAWHYPGLLERNRLYPTRSEWVRGVPPEEIANVFRQAGKRFGTALFVYDDDNVPERWYQFKHRLAQKRKRDAYNTKAPETTFRTTAEDRKRKR